MSSAYKDGVGVIVNASSPTKDSLEFLECLTAFLSEHKVPTVLIIECTTAAEAATASTRLQPICTPSTTHLSLTQPLNTHATLSAATSLLDLPLSHIAGIKLTNKDVETNTSTDLKMLQMNPEKQPPRLLFSLVVLHIASVMKDACPSLLCIAYLMKESRQMTLTANNMLPFVPIHGTFFLPLDIEFINETIVNSAQKVVDVVLHKATDFFETTHQKEESSSNVDDNAAPAVSVSLLESGSVPHYRPELHFILEKLHSSGCCIIDPLESLEIVIDRVQMAHALDAACIAARKLALPVRTPAWHLLEHPYSPEVLRTASSVSKVSLPCVLKPRVACGVDIAHQMAFILHPTGLFPDLEVPLPAVLQEYVDHKSTVWKVYVAGDQVFSVQKRSTPDLQPLRDFLASHLGGGGGGGGRGVAGEEEETEDLDVPTSIEFNSLESLPVSLPWLSRLMDPGSSTETAATDAAGSERPPAPPPPAAVMHSGFLTQLANVFRKHLGLTLFGFDVVFDYSAGEAVVLDLNFFPSFRGIPEAPEALRAAVLEKYKKHQRDGKKEISSTVAV